LLPPGLVFADTPSRIIAFLLDSVLLGVAYSIAVGLFGFDYTSISLGHWPNRDLYYVYTIVAFALNAAYFVWFWTGGRRATPGQRMFQIQVANAFDGQPLTTSQAIKRWVVLGQWLSFAAALPFLALAIASFAAAFLWEFVLLLSMVMSQTKQGLQDRVAGSALVRPAGASNRWAVRALWVLIAIAVFYLFVAIWFIRNIPPEAWESNPYWQEYLHWMWPS
jgi:uncharacterized RDD family membrane protein YckC